MGIQLRETQGREGQTPDHHILQEQTQRTLNLNMAIQPRSEGRGVGMGSTLRSATLLDLVGMVRARQDERVIGFHDYSLILVSVGSMN